MKVYQSIEQLQDIFPEHPDILQVGRRLIVLEKSFEAALICILQDDIECALLRIASVEHYDGCDITLFRILQKVDMGVQFFLMF